MNKTYKTIRYYSEYILLRAIFSFISYLSPYYSSLIFGIIFKFIGPFLKSSHYGRINLDLAFPFKTKQEKKKILAASWENIGRTFGEFPHIPSFNQKTPHSHWKVEGAHFLDEAKKTEKPIIFFSGHLGNWEILPTILAEYKLPFAPFYRAPNNPYIHHYLHQLRSKNTKENMPLFAKGAKGAKGAMRHLSKKKHLGIVGDQKMNDGIEISFFNRPTMSAPASAALALRFNALILMGYIERTRPSHFILHVFPPIEPKDFLNHHQNRHDAVQNLTQFLMDNLQNWITHHPGSWLWCHRRWEKSLYKPIDKK